MNQSCTVIWNGAQSYSFKVSNGVRQGAVTSPILFSVYINGLFRKLRSSGLGCHLFGQFCGCLGYVDDLLVLSESGHRRFFPPIFRGALEDCTAETRKCVALLQLITLKSHRIDLKRCTTFVETVHCFRSSRNFGGGLKPS